MATTTNFGWETPDDTDLVKDGALAIRTLGNSIDTSLMDLKGGTTGQVLSKNSNTDMDFTWVAQDDSNAIQNAIVDAKGDLITATAADTPARLAVGSNGQVLTADSSTATGLKWATAASGGKVLQVVQSVYQTGTTISGTTFADTGLTASITPSATSSKVLILVSQVYYAARSAASLGISLKLLRGSTDIYENGGTANYLSGFVSATGATAVGLAATNSMIYLDSPSSTSSVTYKTQGRNQDSNGTTYYQNDSADSSITLIEIGA